MKNNLAALFDMDGVMIDTESQYSVFWKAVGERFQLGIPNFEIEIKGTTMPNILSKYFSHVSEEDRAQLIVDLQAFDDNLRYPIISGAIDFVKALKASGIKVGLVTSSMDEKMERVNKELYFDALFDTIVSGSRILKGKPAPDCYLLAANDLGISPEHCVVFEDAFTGIQAGNSAGMKVVGLATTHHSDKLVDSCIAVVADFSSITLGEFEGL